MRQQRSHRALLARLRRQVQSGRARRVCRRRVGPAPQQCLDHRGVACRRRIVQRGAAVQPVPSGLVGAAFQQLLHQSTPAGPRGNVKERHARLVRLVGVAQAIAEPPGHLVPHAQLRVLHHAQAEGLVLGELPIPAGIGVLAGANRPGGCRGGGGGSAEVAVPPPCSVRAASCATVHPAVHGPIETLTDEAEGRSPPHRKGEGRRQPRLGGGSSLWPMILFGRGALS